MSKMEERLKEDRELRDAARGVMLADLDHVRETFSAKGLVGRYFGRIGDGARDVFDVAKIHTQDNRGIIAIAIGALLLWFSRDHLLAAFEEVVEERLSDLAQDDADDDSVEPTTDGDDDGDSEADAPADAVAPANETTPGDADEHTTPA